MEGGGGGVEVAISSSPFLVTCALPIDNRGSSTGKGNSQYQLILGVECCLSLPGSSGSNIQNAALLLSIRCFFVIPLVKYVLKPQKIISINQPVKQRFLVSMLWDDCLHAVESSTLLHRKRS